MSIDRRITVELRALYKGGVTVEQLSAEYRISERRIKEVLDPQEIKLSDKKLVELNNIEWRTVARDNHIKISNRPDAIIRHRDIWQ